MPSLSTEKARDVRFQRKLNRDKALKRKFNELEDELAAYRGREKPKARGKKQTLNVEFD